ncbi:hypothetical protein D9M69_726850 [compost metagenome]
MHQAGAGGSAQSGAAAGNGQPRAPAGRRWLLSGRPENVKQALSRGLLEALDASFQKPDGLDVQLQDMERSTYAKAFL